jgi:aspartate/methionine/tyrosine aminotransferase
MHDGVGPESWAPYMTWAKHHEPARWDLSGSNLLPCTVEDLAGARTELLLYAQNDDGYPPLVNAIANRFGVERDRVVTATGAAGATFLALAALVRPGDEVLVEWPGYDPQAGAAHLLGAEVRRFPRPWTEGFRVDPDAVRAALSPRTRVVVLTNLHNPSGVYTSPDVMRKVGLAAAEVGAHVLVDEVYLEILTGVDTGPAAHLGDVFVSVNSLTKTFGLAGLRVGWMLARPEVAERARRARDVVDGVGSVPSEALGALAFERIEELLRRARRIVMANSELMRGFVMEHASAVEWAVPPGASIALLRLLGADDAGPFVEMARREFGVGVTPGRYFGCPGHFRVAISGRRHVLEGGLEALGRALRRAGA